MLDSRRISGIKANHFPDKLLNLRHTAATPVGLEVRAEAEVTKVDGKVITFSIKAYDEKGEIGSAEHTRVVVNSQRFLEKAYQKL